MNTTNLVSWQACWTAPMGLTSPGTQDRLMLVAKNGTFILRPLLLLRHWLILVTRSLVLGHAPPISTAIPSPPKQNQLPSMPTSFTANANGGGHRKICESPASHLRVHLRSLASHLRAMCVTCEHLRVTGGICESATQDSISVSYGLLSYYLRCYFVLGALNGEETIKLN